MSEGYTQTLLLDCNRLSSVEYNASKLSDADNSLFTNKIANGVKLDIGDAVSINSAYISERGAGATVIEFKGRELDAKTEITYTKVTNSSFVGFNEGQLPYNYPLTDGFGIQKFEEIKEVIPLKDNEASIVVQYYKSTNGEMNITLPRRYGSASNTISTPPSAYTSADGYWINPDQQDTGLNTFSQSASHIYADDWNVTNPGDSFMVIETPGVVLKNASVQWPEFDKVSGLPIAAINGSAIMRKIKQDNSRFTLFVKDQIIWSASFITFSPGAGNASIAYNKYLEAQVTERDGIAPVLALAIRDPALHNYIPFQQKVPIKVDPGYDTPSNVADTITDSLVETDKPQAQRWNHRVSTQPDHPAPADTDVYSNIINSTLYKSFPAANYETFGMDKFDAYQKGSSIQAPAAAAGGDVSDLSFDYLNNYAYVGFKRPEFVVKGRAAFVQSASLTPDGAVLVTGQGGGHIDSDIPISTSGTAVIETNVSWTDKNLTQIRDWFDTQRKLYPELISGNRELNSNYTDAFLLSKFETTSASLNASFEDVARFLHINPYTGANVSDNYIFNASALGFINQFNKKSAEHILGNEMNHMPANPLTFNGSMVSQTFSTSDPAKYSTYPYDLSSLPIYVYYNSRSASINGSQSEGTSYSNLVYGFARKTSKGCIAFTTENIGGIPTFHFNEGTVAATTGSGTTPVAGWPHLLGTLISGADAVAGTRGRRIGYDWHFNAYGNAAIMLNSGYNFATFYGDSQHVNASGCRRAMVGANNPVLDFSNVDNRFEFKNLHTAEKIGNFFNAGDPDPASDEIAPPPTDSAGTDCYKINKVSNYVTWSPSMMPYPDITVLKKQNVSHTIPSPNVNMERQRIIDTECGVMITDMGIKETQWDESLWGILGFSYDQFYPNASVVGNTNTRMNNVKTNVSGATTNAFISSIDSTEYRVNQWGSNLYSTQAPLATDYDDKAQWMIAAPAAGIPKFKNINTIVVDAASTAISASALPRKQLRGYYLLKSNILSDANYFREANPMSIMAVVDKYNAEGDFVNYSGGGPVFTVTHPTTLTSIQTSILDPDGSEAQCDKYSGVIYRVDKKINTDLNFAQTILNASPKK